jgi:putative membrane protein
MMYGYNWLWIVAGLIALGLFIALVVVLIVVGVSSRGRNERTYTSQPGQGVAGGSEDPLEILRQRYARGEITREEYEEMRDVLRR